MRGTILVAGGSGLLGDPVARRLEADGFTVRLLARRPEAVRRMFGDSFEVVSGDVSDIRSLERAAQGCRWAHVSVGGPVDRLSAENMAHVAAGAGVERIGYVSGATVFEENRWFPMVEAKLEAERALRESGVAWTVFCPTWPFESLLRFIRNGRATIVGRHPTPYHWFAASDMARMVSRAYTMPEAEGKRLFIHGPEAISMRDALERVVRARHPEIDEVGHMSARAAKLLGILARKPELKFAGELMVYFDTVGEMGDPSEANSMLGAPTITLEEWLRREPAPPTGLAAADRERQARENDAGSLAASRP